MPNIKAEFDIKLRFDGPIIDGKTINIEDGTIEISAGDIEITTSPSVPLPGSFQEVEIRNLGKSSWTREFLEKIFGKEGKVFHSEFNIEGEKEGTITDEDFRKAREMLETAQVPERGFVYEDGEVKEYFIPRFSGDGDPAGDPDGLYIQRLIDREIAKLFGITPHNIKKRLGYLRKYHENFDPDEAIFEPLMDYSVFYPAVIYRLERLKEDWNG